MPDRQAIEFLRRRYAAAILSDDADTACRLRGQLDRIMNAAGRPGLAPRPEAVRSPEVAAQPPKGERSPGPGRFEPRVYVARPVTGLLEGRRFLPRALRSLSASSPDRG